MLRCAKVSATHARAAVAQRCSDCTRQLEAQGGPEAEAPYARQRLHPTRSGHRSAQFASCAAQSSAARTARPGAPFAQKVSTFVARTPIEKISCAGRRFHLSPRAADEIFQPLAKRPIPSKMRQWQKGQGSAQVASASMPAPPWTVESAFGARACETPQLRVSSARAPAGLALR